ncbi:NUDIX hydrolase [Jeotgalibacillus proteolyticus]|uniref:DNA mismatch repair protein MutT n=1 Tax=Jeotgalibacillus proteolyticus TaxID=2082395 RepID=A0A2S5GD94_9BACL|nr:NUDIX domain-containing protein [Jeotgalibacillus proteolyticus]PPA70966.1 DNA mismatch repair protein MutT [Jeotgalibacillus proteolyticus]
MKPRATSLGIIMKENKILLEKQNKKHSKGNGIFYRPLGGTIELGERSRDTLVREFKEEIDADIEVKSYLACLENIYQVDGQVGHEITQLYSAGFTEKQLYEVEQFKVTEPGKKSVALWVPLETLWNEEFILYPEGVKEEVRKIVGACEEGERR